MLTHFCVKRVSGLWAWFLLKVELWVIVLCIWLRWRNRVHVADLYIVGTRLLWWRVWWLVDWLTNNFHLPLAVGLCFFDSQQEESVHLSPHGYGSWGRKHVWTPNWPLFLNCSYNMFQIRIRLFYKTKIGSKSFFFFWSQSPDNQISICNPRCNLDGRPLCSKFRLYLEPGSVAQNQAVTTCWSKSLGITYFFSCCFNLGSYNIK